MLALKIMAGLLAMLLFHGSIACQSNRCFLVEISEKASDKFEVLISGRVKKLPYLRIGVVAEKLL